MLFEIGSSAYLAREIIEPATGDHPAFLMGEKGEQVKVVGYSESSHYPYEVEGSTNPDKLWLALADDLMFSRPMNGN